MHCDFKFKKLQKKKGMKRFQLTNLKVEEIKNSYKEKKDREIIETYDAQYTSSIEEKWGNLKRCILNNADEVLGKSKETKRKECINEKILEMINERRRYKNATDQIWEEKYRKLKNTINRECKKSKEILLNNICQDINEALKVGLMDKAYGIVRRFFKERKVKMASIKEANGNIIYDEAEVAKYWEKYLEQLYREENMTIIADIEEEHQNDTEELHSIELPTHHGSQYVSKLTRTKSDCYI